MNQTALYPLRFAPIYQYRLWGGRRLANWLTAPLPGTGPIGEAWLLSDRDAQPSRVIDGPLEGRTIAQLMADSPEAILGKLARRFRRFPLLLKFLDAHEMLSVQVHPGSDNADLIPAGETGKTEAWIVLEADAASRVYVGLQRGVSLADLRALSERTVDSCLASFTPRAGQGIFIEAGTVHALGGGAVVFEVQQNSDVTFRLYDWDRIDPETGRPRALQVAQALACIDPGQGPVHPIAPAEATGGSILREKLFDSPHFRVWRLQTHWPFSVGAVDEPRVLVCLDGTGNIEYDGADFAMARGDVILLPAAVGACRFRPQGEVTLLEIAVPDLP